MSDADIVREALRHGLIYAEACDGWPSGPHGKAEHERLKTLLREGAPEALDRLEALSRVHVTEASHDLLVAEGWLDPDQAQALKDALREIIRREARSEYKSIYAAPGEFARLASDALFGVRGGEEQRA